MPGIAAGAPNPQMRAILERLLREDAGLPDPTTLPSGEGRALAERTNRRWNADLPEMAEVRDVKLAPGVPGRVLVPNNDEGKGAHPFCPWRRMGLFCSMKSHERAARLLATTAWAPVVTFDYRLAPEHPHPEGLDDCLAAWQAFRSIFPHRHLAMSGDSAGANLVVAAMLRLQAEGRPVPDSGLLFYGVYDDDFDSPLLSALRRRPGADAGQDAALLGLVSAGASAPVRSADLSPEGIGASVVGAAAPLSECRRPGPFAQ